MNTKTSLATDLSFRAEEPERLDRFLARMLPDFSRVRLSELIDAGKVRVDGKVEKRAFKLKKGSAVVLTELPTERPPHDLSPADIPIEVVFEDDYLLVVNKPRGLATHPAASLKAPSLVNALLGRGQSLSGAGGAFRPGIVHRLDKDTTGLIVIAKTDAVHLALARQFEKKTAERRYVGWLEGRLAQDRLRIEAPLARDPRNRLRMAPDPKGRPAITHLVKLLETETGTLVVAELETGRTHQIRAHCLAIGHPVLGDPLYSNKKSESMPLQLHAAFLAFTHPVTNKRLELYVQPPEDFIEKESVKEERIRGAEARS